jgi:hypothetical protein
METKYYITKEQLRFIDHFERMFDSISTDVKQLCIEEKSDVQIGFELGRIYANLRDQHIAAVSITSAIRSQELPNINNSESELISDRQW